MAFEVYSKRNGYSKGHFAHLATLHADAAVSIPKEAHEAIGNADRVRLLFDKETGAFAWQAADDMNSFVVANYSSESERVRVRSKSFMEHYGIPFGKTRKLGWTAEGGMLVFSELS